MVHILAFSLFVDEFSLKSEMEYGNEDLKLNSF